MSKMERINFNKLKMTMLEPAKLSGGGGFTNIQYPEAFIEGNNASNIVITSENLQNCRRANYDICSFASKSYAIHFQVPACKDSKDPEIFDKFCNGNYERCPVRGDN